MRAFGLGQKSWTNPAANACNGLYNCTVLNTTNSVPVTMASGSKIAANNIVWGCNTNMIVGTNVYNNSVGTNDPMLQAASPYKLNTGSPCIDTGNDTYSYGDYDYFGAPRARLVEPHVDIGAHEYIAADAPTETGTAKKRKTILNLLLGGI